jgi:hypothetical protein
MKLYFIIVSFLVVGFSNAQVLPQALIANNNAYPTTFSSNTSISFQSVEYPSTLTNPALKSNFSFNFSNTTPYTMQFMVNKKFNAYSSGFIGFTTAADGLSYSTGSFLFYEFNMGNYAFVLRNYVYNEYLNDNITLSMNTYPVGVTYQVTTVYDGTYWRNYVNGQLVNTNRNYTTWSGTGNLMLGNIGGMTNVILDEVRFWNKALTPEEVASNWNKPLTGREDGLKVYYNFNNQGFAGENNNGVKFIKDQTTNNNTGAFTNMSLTNTEHNFVTDISKVNTYDSSIITLDANILDSYPGNGRGSSYGNTNSKSAFIVHDLFTTTNLYFYSNSSYNTLQLAAPILNADGGRSFLINNIYGKTNNASGISGYGRRTFEAWVKFNSLNNNSVVSIGNLANNDLFEMAVNNGKLILNTGVDFSSNLNIKSNRTLLVNTWYHVVVIYEPYLVISETPKFFNIYINGAFDNDYFTALNANQTSIDAIFSPIKTTNTNIYIGNSLRPFNGKLGSLKIYNRVLSATEILNKYNATKSRFGY